VDAHLDTVATALDARTDDCWRPRPVTPRPCRRGCQAAFSGAELVTLAVMQPTLGPTSEAAGCAS